MADYLLEVEAVSAAYGNIRALQDVSLKVPQGAIVALLGANGAGKSTTLNVISRLVAPTAGGVRFAGEAIHRLPADAIVGRGIVQVPEGREIFRDMSVRENLEMGAYLRRDRGAIRATWTSSATPSPAARAPGAEGRDAVRRRAADAGDRPRHDGAPRMILLDEPSMGLSPLVVEQIFEIILRLNREQGITILLVEQNVKLALSVSSYAYILENGELALEGESAALAEDEAVQKAYLG